MTAKFTFEGLFSPIFTPYLPNGIANHDAVLGGITSGGSLGENFARSDEEAHLRMRFAKERITGGLLSVRMLQQSGKSAQYIKHRLIMVGIALCGTLFPVLNKPKLRLGA